MTGPLDAALAAFDCAVDLIIRCITGRGVSLGLSKDVVDIRVIAAQSASTRFACSSGIVIAKPTFHDDTLSLIDNRNSYMRYTARG